MLPTDPINNTTNIVGTGIKPLGYFSVRKTLMGKMANFPNLILGKFGEGVLLSEIATTLAGHVCHVLGMGSKKEMFWVYARRIIAGMKHALTTWKINVIGKFPHEVVGKDYRLAIPNPSIAFLVFTARPEPAFIVHRYIIPLEYTTWL